MHCHHHHDRRLWALLYLSRYHNDPPTPSRLASALSVVLALASLAGIVVYATLAAIVIWVVLS